MYTHPAVPNSSAASTGISDFFGESSKMPPVRRESRCPQRISIECRNTPFVSGECETAHFISSACLRDLRLGCFARLRSQLSLLLRTAATTLHARLERLAALLVPRREVQASIGRSPSTASLSQQFLGLLLAHR
eukprot:6178514-Pleurochrysis_carterae.AAC.2